MNKQRTKQVEKNFLFVVRATSVSYVRRWPMGHNIFLFLLAIFAWRRFLHSPIFHHLSMKNTPHWKHKVVPSVTLTHKVYKAFFLSLRVFYRKLWGYVHVYAYASLISYTQYFVPRKQAAHLFDHYVSRSKTQNGFVNLIRFLGTSLFHWYQQTTLSSHKIPYSFYLAPFSLPLFIFSNTGHPLYRFSLSLCTALSYGTPTSFPLLPGGSSTVFFPQLGLNMTFFLCFAFANCFAGFTDRCCCRHWLLLLMLP